LEDGFLKNMLSQSKQAGSCGSKSGGDVSLSTFIVLGVDEADEKISPEVLNTAVSWGCKSCFNGD
jgi:hypothetical protein